MHFKVAVRNFHDFGDSLTDVSGHALSACGSVLYDDQSIDVSLVALCNYNSL